MKRVQPRTKQPILSGSSGDRRTTGSSSSTPYGSSPICGSGVWGSGVLIMQSLQEFAYAELFQLAATLGARAARMFGAAAAAFAAPAGAAAMKTGVLLHRRTGNRKDAELSSRPLAPSTNS